MPALSVSVPAGQTFDGGNTYDCSTADYLYGSGSATVGSATAVTANSLSASPTLYLQHALSQVVFRIQNANDRTPDPTYDYVKKIKLTAAGSATPFFCTTASGSGSAGTMSLTDGALSGLAAVGEISLPHRPVRNRSAPRAPLQWPTGWWLRRLRQLRARR